MDYLSQSSVGTALVSCISTECYGAVRDSLSNPKWRVVELNCHDAIDKESLICLAIKAFGCDDPSNARVTSWDVALDVFWQSIAFEERRVAILCIGFDGFFARDVQLAFDWLEVLHSLAQSVSTRESGGKLVLVRVVVFGQAYPKFAI